MMVFDYFAFIGTAVPVPLLVPLDGGVISAPAGAALALT